MGFFGTGNPPRTSTQAAATNPTTSVLLAEITGLGGELNRAGVLYEARIVLGASTLAQFLIEQCLSSGLGSTALRTETGELGRKLVFATVHQSAQYVLRFSAQPGDRVRVRLNAAITGDAAAVLQIEAVV